MPCKDGPMYTRLSIYTVWYNVTWSEHPLDLPQPSFTTRITLKLLFQLNIDSYSCLSYSNRLIWCLSPPPPCFHPDKLDTWPLKCYYMALWCLSELQQMLKKAYIVSQTNHRTLRNAQKGGSVLKTKINWVYLKL